MKRFVLTLLTAVLFLHGMADDRQADDRVDTLRVLAIGNSFSEDAVEQYLYELAKESGVELIIGNAYRGGQGLESHWREVSGGNSTFGYRKIVGGTKTDTKDQALRTIIADEPWDVITLQQVSQDSGRPETYEPYLSYLIGYVRALATNPSVKLGFHQTWAYAPDSTHGGFAHYGKDQATMYAAIVDAVERAVKRHAVLSFVVPSGTAIQNARTSSLGNNLTRDGYHLDFGIGRYIAACTWLEAVTGKTAVGRAFRPQGVSAGAATIAQQSAHQAVVTPNAVTSMAK